MPEGLLLEFRGLTKRFGHVTAVDDLSFTVEPGRVTGFLGPNGAGKTTTLRMLLGLVCPTAGETRIGGEPYSRLARPFETIGATLEAASFHPGRSGRNHLAVYARAAGIPLSRADVVLERVGMAQYGTRRVSGYSLGMRQRLSLALALLGDPGVLVLDEPVNGLDPEGIRWIRTFLREMAGEGRTVLVSSHLLSEVQQSVDEVVIVAKGRLVHRGTLGSMDSAEARRVVVDADDRPALASALAAAGLESSGSDDGLHVSGAEAADVGRIAFAAGIPLTALLQQRTGLEDSFLSLVGGPAPDATNGADR